MSFRTEDALNKHLAMFNDTGRRTVHNNDYITFDKFHYKKRIPFAMFYDIDCVIKNRKHNPIACGLYKKVTILIY